MNKKQKLPAWQDEQRIKLPKKQKRPLIKSSHKGGKT